MRAPRHAFTTLVLSFRGRQGGVFCRTETLFVRGHGLFEYVLVRSEPESTFVGEAVERGEVFGHDYHSIYNEPHLRVITPKAGVDVDSLKK